MSLRTDDTLYLSELRERGWSPAMVRDLLGEPDHPTVHTKRGRVKSAARWDIERVEAAEAGPGFAVRRAKAAVRSKAGKLSAEKRAAATLEWARTVEIESLPEMTIAFVLRAGMESWRKRQRVYGFSDAPPSPERAAVNWLRHQRTRYDDLLNDEARFGTVGIVEARWTIRRRVYAMIAERFPELKDECQAQIAVRERRAGVSTAFGGDTQSEN